MAGAPCASRQAPRRRPRRPRCQSRNSGRASRVRMYTYVSRYSGTTRYSDTDVSPPLRLSLRGKVDFKPP
eukprot:4066231-Prymnesium_polylepis.1